MVQIGKFEIFATYSYVKARLTGSSEAQAKEYGYMIAVMGARGKGGRGGYPGKKSTGATTIKKAAPKKASVFSAADYDGKIVAKMGAFYKQFLPAIEKLVKAGLSYDQVKAKIDFPKGRGTKMEGAEFLKRAAKVST